MLVTPGFWRSSPTATVVRACKFGGEACIGGVYRNCAHAYVGHACSMCAKGYGMQSNGCFECEDTRVTDKLQVARQAWNDLSRLRRRHVHCAGMGVPVLKMTASE